MFLASRPSVIIFSPVVLMVVYTSTILKQVNARKSGCWRRLLYSMSWDMWYVEEWRSPYSFPTVRNQWIFLCLYPRGVWFWFCIDCSVPKVFVFSIQSDDYYCMDCDVTPVAITRDQEDICVFMDNCTTMRMNEGDFTLTPKPAAFMEVLKREGCTNVIGWCVKV